MAHGCREQCHILQHRHAFVTDLWRSHHTFVTLSARLDTSFYAAYAVDSAGRILRDRRHDGSPTAYTQRLFGYDDLGELVGSKDVSNLSWNCGGSGSFDPNYGYIGCPIER